MGEVDEKSRKLRKTVRNQVGWARALLQEGLELRRGGGGMHLKNWSETWSSKATVSRRLNWEGRPQYYGSSHHGIRAVAAGTESTGGAWIQYSKTKL